MPGVFAPICSDTFSPIGETPLVIRDVAGLKEQDLAELRGLRAAVRIGVDRGGDCPDGLGDAFDLLLTMEPSPGREWVSRDADALQATLDAIRANVAACPVAATTLCQTLRIGQHLSVADALIVESLAYSTLLGGTEFRAWRARTPVGAAARTTPTVDLDRRGTVLEIRINHPETHNAIGAAVRDGLVEALRLAAADDSIERVILCGAGRSFSSGGALDEFGSATDAAFAHVVRTMRSVVAEAHPVAHKLRVMAKGANIGAGIEIAAAASEVVATPGAHFRLPELGMGLIPGAGGTVTVPRRIGRWRTAWLVLTGRRIGATTAEEWGLVDRIVDD